LISSLTTKTPYPPNTIKKIPITLNHRLIKLPWLKNAKKYEEEAKVSASTAKKLANPEEKLTKKTEQEVKKSGTKLQKLMLKIRQEDYKTAINLWKYFIGHAYYEKWRPIAVLIAVTIVVMLSCRQPLVQCQFVLIFADEGVDSFCQFNIPLSNWHHSSQIHSKNAKKYEEEAKVSASTAEKLAYPEKLTKKTEQEIKKSGTKLQKLMFF
jgi:hypothetical protein